MEKNAQIIKILKLGKKIQESKLKLLIIEKELLELKKKNEIRHELKKNFFYLLILRFFNLVKKGFIMFTSGFHVAFNKKDNNYFKKRFRKLYYINKQRKINLDCFSKLNYYDEIFQYAYLIPLKFLNHNPYIYVFKAIGIISIMLIALKINFFYYNVIIIIAILYTLYLLLLSIIKVFNLISISIFIFSNKNVITSLYLTKIYDKFFFILGFLSFNLLNIIKEICVFLTKIFLIDRIGLIENILICKYIKEKILYFFGIEIIE
jgi:hypothetical protein